MGKLSRILAEMDSILKHRLQTKFPLLEDHFTKAIEISEDIQEIGVDTTDIDDRISVLQDVYTKVQKSLGKEAKKHVKQSTKRSAKRCAKRSAKRSTKRSTKKLNGIPNKKSLKKPIENIKEQTAPPLSGELPVHTILDPAPDAIDVISLGDDSKSNTQEISPYTSKWTTFKSMISRNARNGSKYIGEKIMQGWKWLRARSSDDVVFGVRTLGSISATIFALLTGIGLIVGWNVPSLLFIFVISAVLFVGSELLRIIRTIISKRSPKEVI
ncbi:MAG: hypothetical protein ACTSYI_07715 [Promethearchaeota archaeon]